MAVARQPVVGVTADRRWEEQADLFRRRGIAVLHGPTMRTLDLAGSSALRSATSSLVAAPPTLLVATTGMGMRAWLAAADGWGQRDALLAALGARSSRPAAGTAAGSGAGAGAAAVSGGGGVGAGGPADGAEGAVGAVGAGGPADGAEAAAGFEGAGGQPSRVTVIARGAKASSALRQAGLEVAWRAPGESMAEVVDWVATAPEAVRARVALQLFEPDEHPSTVALRALAGELVEVPVYKWLRPLDPAPAERLLRAAVAGELAAVTFTSQPAVHFLFALADELGLREALLAAFDPSGGGVLPVCIGAVCAEALVEEGVTDPIWPEPFRLPPMVRLVADRLGVPAAP
jgi:uroporphyrinogen-III synthase